MVNLTSTFTHPATSIQACTKYSLALDKNKVLFFWGLGQPTPIILARDIWRVYCTNGPFFAYTKNGQILKYVPVNDNRYFEVLDTNLQVPTVPEPSDMLVMLDETVLIQTSGRLFLVGANTLGLFNVSQNVTRRVQVMSEARQMAFFKSMLFVQLFNGSVGVIGVDACNCTTAVPWKLQLIPELVSCHTIVASTSILAAHCNRKIYLLGDMLDVSYRSPTAFTINNTMYPTASASPYSYENGLVFFERNIFGMGHNSCM